MSLKRSASVAVGAEGLLQPLMEDLGGSNSQPTSVLQGNGAAAGKDDFGRTVRKRLQNTTRTGQACDRCKIRKIRCDGLSGGCSPCRQNNTECRTTDRISHRAVPRGYIEQLEMKCADYEAKIKDMEALLQAGGLASPGKQSHDGNSSASGSTLGWSNQADSKDPWQAPEQSSVKLEQHTLPFAMDYNPHKENSPVNGEPTRSPSREEPDPNGRPAFLVRKSGTQHINMYSGNSYMTSTRASALSVLGISIDIADIQGIPEPARSLNYIPINAQMDFTEANPLDDSLQSFLMSVSRYAPVSILQLGLPSKEEALMLMEWNFAFTQPYLPILHKPTFMAEFHRMFDIPDYKTSPAHLVITHTILAMSMYFIAKRQMKVDTPQQPDLTRAFRHYHFSLSFLNLLLAGGTLEDCQAMIFLLAFTRGFARPGPAYLLSKITTATIFELRLHRSLKKQHEKAGIPLNVLEDEMRKRVFWTGMSIDVGISAKLNRPIGVITSDYDVEYPERIEDEFITESGFTQDPLPPDARCSFDVAFGLIKCAEFTIEIHTKLYGAVKPSKSEYQPLVEAIEAKMTAWKDALPAHLKYDPSSQDIISRLQAGNLMLWYNELRILLRHPSLDLSISPSFSSDNLTICVESSRTILEMTDLLRREHNLDPAWYATSVPLLACMTILFAIWEKRETVTQTEIARVKADMELSASVMKDFGELSGGNNKLGDIIVSLTEGTMKMLRERHGSRLATTKTGSNSNSLHAPASTKRRASVSTKTFAPPSNHELQQQQSAMNQISHLNKHYTYSQPQVEQHISAAQQASLYVDPNVNTIPQMNHGNHVSLSATYADASHLRAQDAVHSAATALAAAAAAQQHQQQQHQHQQQTQQPQQHPQYYIPHTSAADTQLWYGASENWKEYLTQMTSLAGDSQGFPAMALMSLGQPVRGDLDGTWGFMNVYDYETNGTG
ncbi:hypothetical protein H072_11612 [Dactylellina haptotyla CBS 200.50]|uniref:Zn(2)-C6 fungal-type domain-containing protein n=1 Tax=Dactylellina haptotyla (strain CBS 200.50) TaxID=1284197 RepID=S8B7Y8_DACHA|nr:hypothetical protein H072_11612 [Dactylellina haptotyla CBS 200.50]